MRAFEYNSYLDNEGKPLVGRFLFYKNNTEELATIYDKDGNVIDNPVLSNTIGQPHIQVFLPNEDVLIVVEKANHTEEGDVFEFQYSFVDKYKVFEVLLESGGFPIAPTIESLRNTDPNTIQAQYGFKEIVLAGYNVYGDCPSVHYKWIDNITLPDNGGNIIAGTTTDVGRWQMVVDSLSNVDVRHFGIFGKRTYSDTDYTQASQINVAAAYSEQVGKPLFFPSIFIDSKSVYRLSNATINAEFADNTKLYSNSGTSYVTVIGNTSPVIDSNNAGAYYIYGSVLKTSMVESNNRVNNIHIAPTDKLVWDKNIAVEFADTYSYSNITVDFKTSTANTVWTLNNCEIISDNKILGKAHKFIACEIKESYFSNSVTKSQLQSMTFTNCSSEPYYWTKFDLYITFMNTQGYNDIDFKGKSFTFNSDIVITDPVSISNVNITGPNGIVIAANNVKFYNSTVYLKGAYTSWIYNNIVFDNCVIQSAVDNNNFYSVFCANSTVNAKIACSGPSKFEDCTISNNLYLGPYANVLNCSLSTTVYLYPSSTQQMWFTLNDNTFSIGRFEIINRTVDSSTTDMTSIVAQKCIITNNYGNGSTLLAFDKSKFSKSQAYYIYRNNVADGISPVKDIQLTIVDNTDSKGNERTTGAPELWVDNSSNGTSIHNVKLSDIIFSFGEDTATRPTKYRIQVLEDQFNTLGASHLATAWLPAVPHATGYYMVLMNGMSSNQYGPSYYKNAILTEDHYKNVEINLGTNGDSGDNYQIGSKYKFRFVVEELY